MAKNKPTKPRKSSRFVEIRSSGNFSYKQNYITASKNRISNFDQISELKHLSVLILVIGFKFTKKYNRCV